MQDYNSHTQESEQAQKAFNTEVQVQVCLFVFCQPQING